MNSKNKRLIVSFSNHIQWSGLMTVSFVKEQADILYPDENIKILIQEIDTDSYSLTPISIRENDGWIDIQK